MRSVLDKFKKAVVSCFDTSLYLPILILTHFSELILSQLQTSSAMCPGQISTKGIAVNESSGGCSNAENIDAKKDDKESKESYGSDVKEGCNCG
jgi:hypothetical protein